MSSVHTTRSPLAAALHPVSVSEFVTRYFGSRPLLVRGHVGKFDALLKPARFIHGLDRVTEIRCVFESLRQASIDPGDIREMYEAGATICVTGVEAAHTSLRAAARRIAQEIGFAGRVDFRAYLSPPGSGFDFHYDARVTTALQLEGTKTWWYSAVPYIDFPTENSGRADMAAVERSVRRHKLRVVTLRPGDLLCLPAGVWHKARAGRGGSLALNMAFNHSGATVGDVVLQALRELLSQVPSARQPYCTGPASAPRPGLAGQVEECLSAVATVAADIARSTSRRDRLARAARGVRQRG